ncbi:MAG: response regulator [Spongiibacteraceae bacterium]
MTRESADDFYSTTEAAALLDVAVRTVQLWVERGVLNAWKTPGGHRRIDAGSVRRLLDQRQRVSSAAECRILIVEDQPEHAEFLKLFVQAVAPRAGIQIARNGLAAMLCIGREPPNLVLLDLLMPQMDGFEMLRELASDRDLQRMRVVVVSSMDDDDIRSRGGLPATVAAVLRKPIEFEALKDILQRELGQHAGATVADPVVV